ncbi:uncharacterized protein BO66DRAFT_437814 [Aspergillus aculeatinus CBS 121060]|uniref:Uncharacterized protein n=1 Tax=Aspergillus aculeatinus CBS 121060 TaxID=1448322 RepID=A0ACD1HAN1_9EURO|nr:hypothetical protein BO66DRAFT_437814 [Aspergillus aculeatinus CBS 121060]RAH70866.1 hypothetical protein BO66DRAFT_437814 [Aspergillus aculeatinus CBS 121060]
MQRQRTNIRALQRTLTQQSQRMQALEQAVDHLAQTTDHALTTLAQHANHLETLADPLQPLLTRIQVLDGLADDAAPAAGAGGSIELDLWLIAARQVEDPPRARRWRRRFHHLYGYRYQNVWGRIPLDARVAEVFDVHADLMVMSGLPARGRMALLDRCRAFLGGWVYPGLGLGPGEEWMEEEEAGEERREAHEGIVRRFGELRETAAAVAD